MEFLPTEIDGKEVYANFWHRCGAGLIDFIVLLPSMLLLSYMAEWPAPLVIILVVLNFAIYPIYTTFFHTRYGATLGKMFFKIKVTQPNGAAIGFKQALLRSSIDILLAILAVVAEIFMLIQIGANDYLSNEWMQSAGDAFPFYIFWLVGVSLITQFWYWSEFLVVLLNKRKRAIHDFIAGTVVIDREYALLDSQSSNATLAT